ncbi:hypothetical protein [Dyella sp.]|uniref:hypothetical protein n=1 Tax=Dyella sp. TaxID=1869338 RepID=UPI002D77FED8|nr:hypothetical protein [Dyella sp.]HET7332898.1 hypothetical protein [Dyella sp.]
MIDEDQGIPIPLDDLTEEAWTLQLGRAAAQGGVESLRVRLATCFATTLVECLDADLKPPTKAQLKYATAIARDLNVALPGEALRFRGAMAEFLNRFVEVHKQRRRSHSHGNEADDD